MKLYSILVYHKEDGGKAKALKAAFDLSSFSFFQRSSVQVIINSFSLMPQEFMNFTGGLLVERSALGSRSSVKENEYFCHCYVRPDGLSGVCVTDAEYQARPALSMLGKVLDDFTSKCPRVTWVSASLKPFKSIVVGSN